jgi:twitching motility protein PilU
MKDSREQGMQTFDQALYDLYAEGKISYEDALNSADSRNEVRLMIKLGAETNGAFNAGMALSDTDDDSGVFKTF